MTKEELRSYKSIKEELTELDRLASRLSRHDMPEAQELYAVKCDALTQTLQRFEQALDTLRPTERRIMRLRYIDRLSWEAIALRIHYSKPQTLRIHQSALNKLRDK